MRARFLLGMMNYMVRKFLLLVANAASVCY